MGDSRFKYMKAPFPYFGGKSEVAWKIWEALGNPNHYIEPCFGSGAVLLNRPNWNPSMVETVNDKDGMIANVWRSLQFKPDEVSKWCDWPVNHADLMARKRELRRNEDRLVENLINDPEWCDPKMAGYWIYQASCSIGNGMKYRSKNCIPNINSKGKSVNINLYDIQIPKLSGKGQGINGSQISDVIIDDNQHVQDVYKSGIYIWFRKLSERLRNVRVICGDWLRVCGGNWQDYLGSVSIFFDPPYGVIAKRSKDCYNKDDLNIADKIAKWCVKRGNKPTYRIVLAGYFEEHGWLLNEGWRVYRWQANGGYANQGKDKTQGCLNKKREALFFSPHCLDQERELL